MREIERSGGDAFYQPLDVRRGENCAAMVDAALTQFGHLDIAFDNASIRGSLALIESLGPRTWREVIDLNLTALFNCMVHERRAMTEHGGSIVNTAPITHQAGTPDSAPHSVSDQGVIGMMRTAAPLYGRYGVRINAFCPDHFDAPAEALAYG